MGTMPKSSLLLLKCHSTVEGKREERRDAVKCLLPVSYEHTVINIASSGCFPYVSYIFCWQMAKYAEAISANVNIAIHKIVATYSFF